MSTHSAIGILNGNGLVYAVYCHNDGYPSGSKFAVGVILQNHYRDEQKVRELIRLGDLSAVGENVYPDHAVEHSFDHPQEGVTIAYHRDRGDELQPAQVFESVAEYVEQGSQLDVEYLYLYDPSCNSWRVYSIYGDKKWEILEGK